MPLTLERPDYEYFLRSADDTSALVNDRTLRSSFIIAPDALVEHWAVTDITALAVADLAPLLALKPEVIVLGRGVLGSDVPGSGMAQAFPPPQTLAACLSHGVGLETMTNAAAARTYSVLASENRRVVAGFVFASAVA